VCVFVCVCVSESITAGVDLALIKAKFGITEQDMAEILKSQRLKKPIVGFSCALAWSLQKF
jgi:hypothetical protein